VFFVATIHCQPNINANAFYYLSQPEITDQLGNNKAQYYGRTKILAQPANTQTENIYFAQYVIDQNRTITHTLISTTYLSFFSILSTQSPPIQNVLHSRPLNSSLSYYNNDYCNFLPHLQFANIISFTENGTNALILTSEEGKIRFFDVALVKAIHTRNATFCEAVELGNVDIGANISTTSVFVGFIVGYDAPLAINGSVNATEYGNTTLYVMFTTNGTYTFDISDPENIDFTYNNITALSVSPNLGRNGIVYMLSFVGNNTNIGIIAYDLVLGNTSVVVRSINTLGLLVSDSTNSYFFIADPIGQNLYVYNFQGSNLATYSTCDPWQQLIYFEGTDLQYCPNGCKGSGHGTCVNNQCSCINQWAESDCSGCDSSAYCNGRGICEPYDTTCFRDFVDLPNRTCSCISGWQGDNCNICNSDLLCTGHGTCSSSGCACMNGYSGNNCSTCDGSVICNNHGTCFNGTCTCEPYWVTDSCYEFKIPNKYINGAVDILNFATVIVWAFYFLFAASAVLVQDSHVGETLMRYISVSATQAQLAHLQSFALVLSNNSVLNTVAQSRYFYFYMFNLNVVKTFDWLGVRNSIWTESALFLPKAIFLIVSLVIFKLVKNPRFRGVFLQFGLYFHFTLLVSIFERFQNRPCDGCTKTFNIISSIGALFVLLIFVYLAYRLWKVIIENKLNLEILNRDYDTYVFSKPTPGNTFIASLFYRVCTVIFYPWSEVVSAVFKGICGISENRSDNESHVGKFPPLTPLPPTPKKKQERDLTVEEFLSSILRQANLQDHEIDLPKITAMLKGNWYTTVADLRTLTAADAEKLKIPLRLFRAMQEELPKEDKPEAYTALDSLVRTTQTENFVKTFQCATDEYQLSYIFFKLDNILTRNFLWALLGVALWQYPVPQMLALAIFQLWYTLFLLWHRPHKYTSSLIAEIIAEMGMTIVLFILLLIAKTGGNYDALVGVSAINFVVIISTSCSKIIGTVYESIASKKEEEKERMPLIKDTIDKDFRSTKPRRAINST